MFIGRFSLNAEVPLHTSSKGNSSHYRWQLEHQFLVSKAQTGHLYVFDGTDGILLEVTPCPDRWQAIHEAWNGFMECIGRIRRRR